MNGWERTNGPLLLVSLIQTQATISNLHLVCTTQLTLNHRPKLKDLVFRKYFFKKCKQMLMVALFNRDLTLNYIFATWETLIFLTNLAPIKAKLVSFFVWIEIRKLTFWETLHKITRICWFLSLKSAPKTLCVKHLVITQIVPVITTRKLWMFSITWVLTWFTRPKFTNRTLLAKNQSKT